MTKQSKPTIFLLTGCFSKPTCFDRLLSYLHNAGYNTIAAGFPSSNPEDPETVSVQKDIGYVRNEHLIPLVEKEHKDALLAVHSFSGVVGSAAAVGLNKVDRQARGERGGVFGLVYIAGNIVQEGQTLIESAGGQWPPWFIKDKPKPGVAIIDPVMPTLYGDLQDKSLQPEVEAALTPHGYHCLETPASKPCWDEKGYEGRRGYIRTKADAVNPAFAQDLWIEGSGVSWDVVKTDWAHCPYVTFPEELARHIVGFSSKFEKL